MNNRVRVLVGVLVSALVAALAFVAGGAAATPGQAANEGIEVHGAWTIDVHDADGTLAASHYFENGLEPTGASTLISLLAGGRSAGAWGVRLSDVVGTSPCEADDGSDTPCFVVEPDYPTHSPGWGTGGERFPVLTVESVNIDDLVYNDQLVLSGTFTATRDGFVDRVITSLETCDGHDSPDDCPGTSPSGASQNQFTSKDLDEDIEIAEGQSVSVTVEISFS